MILRLFLAICLFSLQSVQAVAADTYRWEDAQGNVYYGDESPPAEARNIQRPTLYRNSSEEVWPYQLQLAVSRFPVTLYVTDCGPHCDAARELLINRGVPHTVMDATNLEVQEELMALTSGNREVPVIKIGRSVIRGFEAAQWNGALDVAGYPGVAIVEVQPTVSRLSTPAAGNEAKTEPFDAADEAEFDGDDDESEGIEEPF